MLNGGLKFFLLTILASTSMLSLSSCKQNKTTEKTSAQIVAAAFATVVPATYHCSDYSDYDSNQLCEAGSYARCDPDWKVFPNGQVAQCYKPRAGWQSCAAPPAVTPWIYTPWGTISYDSSVNTFFQFRNLIGCSSAVCLCSAAVDISTSMSGELFNDFFSDHTYVTTDPYLFVDSGVAKMREPASTKYSNTPPDVALPVPTPVTSTPEPIATTGPTYASWVPQSANVVLYNGFDSFSNVARAAGPVLNSGLTAAKGGLSNNIVSLVGPDFEPFSSYVTADPATGSGPDTTFNESGFFPYWGANINGGYCSALNVNYPITGGVNKCWAFCYDTYGGATLWYYVRVPGGCPSTITTKDTADKQVGAASLSTDPSQLVYYHTNTALAQMSDFTISFWIKPNSNGGGCTEYPIGAGATFEFKINSDCSFSNTINIWTASQGTINSPAHTLRTDAWQQIVFTFKHGSGGNGVGTMYLNGTLFNSSTMANSTGDFSLFYLGWAGAAMDGKLDELAIWSTALTEDEVQTIYQHQTLNPWPKVQAVDAAPVGDSNSRQKVRIEKLEWQSSKPFGKELSAQADTYSATSYTGSSSGINLSNGLVSLWHLNETNSNAGLIDSIGTNTLSIPGSAGIQFSKKGILNSAIGIRNSSDYVAKANTTLPSGSASRTIAGWFKTSNIGQTRTTIISYGSHVLNQEFTIGVQALGNYGQGNLYASLGPSSTVVVGASNVADGRWHHFAVTALSSMVAIYIDGSLESNTIPSGLLTASGTGLYLAKSADPSTGTFTGDLDEFAVWSRSLSGTEILELYDRGAKQIKFQLRACDDVACTNTPVFTGPDGTTTNYYTEATANTAISPSLSLSAYIGQPAANYFYQYRMVFQSYATVGMPSVSSITVTPTANFSGYSVVEGSFVIPASKILYGFGEKLGSNGCIKGVRYQLQCDASGYKYRTAIGISGIWDTASADDSKGNTAAEINSLLFSSSSRFPCVSGSTLKWKAFLRSDGGAPCELDNVNVLAK